MHQSHFSSCAREGVWKSEKVAQTHPNSWPELTRVGRHCNTYTQLMIRPSLEVVCILLHYYHSLPSKSLLPSVNRRARSVYPPSHFTRQDMQIDTQQSRHQRCNLVDCNRCQYITYPTQLLIPEDDDDAASFPDLGHFGAPRRLHEDDIGSLLIYCLFSADNNIK